MAPEVFERGTCLKSDIWSLGITLIELAEGKNPIGAENEAAAVKSICYDPSPSLSSSTYSADFVDFVSKCLLKDPQQRPSVAELLQVCLSGTNHT